MIGDKRMKFRLFTFGLWILSLTSCNNEEVVVYTYNTYPRYTWGVSTNYGQEYASKGVEQVVFGIQLYTDSLKLNAGLQPEGVGQYLYLEDVYAPSGSETLPEGTYQADTAHTAFHFAVGGTEIYDGQVFEMGSYIRYYEKNANKSLRRFIRSGTMRVEKGDGNVYRLIFDLVTDDRKPLKGEFYGVLTPRIGGYLAN